MCAHCRLSKLFWTAPEILRTCKSFDAIVGTEEGDVFSFAIIMNEVLCGASPFHDICLGPREIIDIIAGRAAPPANLQIASTSSTVRTCRLENRITLHTWHTLAI